MKPSIYAGKRILYKDGKSGWQIGEVDRQPAEVNEQGVWIAIIPEKFFNKKPDYIQYAEINNLFTDVLPLDESLKQYSEYFMTKNEYIKFMDTDDFDRQRENAYFSDGEYIYYPVSKFSENWILKQPFEYIVRSD